MHSLVHKSSNSLFLDTHQTLSVTWKFWKCFVVSNKKEKLFLFITKLENKLCKSMTLSMQKKFRIGTHRNTKNISEDVCQNFIRNDHQKQTIRNLTDFLLKVAKLLLLDLFDLTIQYRIFH